jgi:hypothetical protein
VTLDSEQALRQSVHQARVDVAKDAVSRSRAAADFVRNAAAALVTIYTGVIGATFAVTKEPLPERGLVPALFLGAAIVFSAAYTAFATRPRDAPVPALPTNLLEREIQRLNAFVEWANGVVVRRLFCLHAAVLSLGAGALLLPTPFLGWSDLAVWLAAIVGAALTLVASIFTSLRARADT